MAKRRLFGNKPEPRCETCTYGKQSPDGSIILCRRSGAAPKYHHCRHYHYDPLKRTPPRQKPLDAFDAAAFSLSGLGDDLSAPANTTHPAGADEMLDRLHSYLNDTATPDAKSILDILAVDTKPAAVKEAAPESEPESATESAPESDPAPSLVQPQGDDITPSAPIIPNVVPAPMIPDNTPDIFEDLKRLQIDAAASSAHAALQDFSLKFGENLDDEDDLSVETAVDQYDSTILTLTEEEDSEEDLALDANDLILTSLDDPDADETVEMLQLNDDGTIDKQSTKIADLPEY